MTTRPPSDSDGSLAICHRDIETLMSSADKLEARNAELEAERDALNKLVAGRGKRINELEALSAPEIHRHYMRGYNAANAKRRRVYLAELEADRDRCSRIIDTLGTDSRRLEAERDRLRARLKQTGEFIKRWDDGFGYGDWNYPEFKAEYEAIRAALSGEGATT